MRHKKGTERKFWGRPNQQLTAGAALGDRYEAANPLVHEIPEFVKKIKLQQKRDPSSGGGG